MEGNSSTTPVLRISFSLIVRFSNSISAILTFDYKSEIVCWKPHKNRKEGVKGDTERCLETKGRVTDESFSCPLRMMGME
jgi:hypothetical protein